MATVNTLRRRGRRPRRPATWLYGGRVWLGFAFAAALVGADSISARACLAFRFPVEFVAFGFVGGLLSSPKEEPRKAPPFRRGGRAAKGASPLGTPKRWAKGNFG